MLRTVPARIQSTMIDPLTGALHRSDQAYFSQIASADIVTAGVAYVSPAYPDLADANQIYDAVADEDFPQLFTEVNACFDRLNLRCLRWVPASGTPHRNNGAVPLGAGIPPGQNEILRPVRMARAGASRGHPHPTRSPTARTLSGHLHRRPYRVVPRAPGSIGQCRDTTLGRPPL